MAVNESEACEVPLIEQLRSVPVKLRTSYAFQWASDGTETGHSFVPVGFMMHRAADELAALSSERDQLRAALEFIASMHDPEAPQHSERHSMYEAARAARAALKEPK